ncbi:MAG: SRPBCC family protein [Opitutaceae bacterium]
MAAMHSAFPSDRELVIERVFHASREKVYRCWTDPQVIIQWFTPPPFRTVRAVMDVRPGGSSCITMQSPEGQEFPNPGVFLEVVPNERLVLTDAYVSGWEPSAKPFMTCILTFENAGPGRTKYTARVRHWSVADREAHERMGFHQGWGVATDQLEAAAQRLWRSPAGVTSSADRVTLRNRIFRGSVPGLVQGEGLPGNGVGRLSSPKP